MALKSLLNANTLRLQKCQLFLLPLVYGTTVVVASVAVGRRLGRAVRLLGVFPAIHLAWAAGFLVGPPTGGQRVNPLA